MTIRVEPELKERLNQLAVATQRSKSYLAAQALRDYIELNEWQIQEIEEAIKEADKGEFASEAALAKTREKWDVDAR